MTQRLLHIVLFISIAFVACRNEERCERGEGASVKRTLSFDALEGIELNMVSDVIITQDTFQEGILIEAIAQSQMQDILEFEANGTSLDVHLSGCIREHSPVTINMRFNTLPNQLVITSAGSIQSGELLEIDSLNLVNQGLGDIDLLLSSNEVNAQIESSGDILLGGICGRLNMTTSGSGDLKAFNLVADTIEIEYNGSNFIEVHAEKRLVVDFDVPGRVHYRGNPQIITRGDGELIDRNL